MRPTQGIMPANRSREIEEAGTPHVRGCGETVFKMSIPRELLDQLLTGYLDDALSADERAHVQQLLNSDGEVVKELAQLRELRRSLQAVAKADSDIKLDPGFADRVLGAAVARASAEGLAEDHPLVRLAEQPSTTRTTGDGSVWRVAGILVALAASIAIAVFTLRPAADDPRFQIAVVPDIPIVDPGAAVIPDPVGIVEPEREPSGVLDPGLIASGSPTGVEPESGNPDGGTASVESVAGNTDMDRAVPSTPELATPELATTDLDSDAAGVGAILVLHIKRTNAGRESRAVIEAMRLASLAEASKKEVTSDMAGFVSETQEESGEASLLYLQAPAKNLDRFYLRLLSDEEGIESVGMSIAFKAPILRVVDALRAEPTAVRHQSASMELLSDEGVVEHIVAELRQLEFAPMNRGAMDLRPTKGADEIAQVLVLIR